MRRVSRNMPRRGLFFPIDTGKVNVMAFVLFFNRNTSAIVFDAYAAAEHGDPSGLALMNLVYDFFVLKSFVSGDFFAKGASADMDLSRDYTADLRDPNSIIGSPISLMVWLPLSKAWTQETLPQELREARSTDAKTRLISGSLDFSTSAAYARDELLPSLKNGKQVIISEAGHVGDVWGVQPEATTGLLTSVYDTGVADDSLYHDSRHSWNIVHPRNGFRHPGRRDYRTGQGRSDISTQCRRR
jgi:hypothetical protein